VKRPIKWVLLAGRLGIGVLLAYSAIHMLADPVLFAEQVDNYRMLPRALVDLVALGLPWAEMLVGICLVAGLMVDAAASLSAVMFGVFAIAMLTARLRGLDISCGCHVLEFGGETGITIGQISVRCLLLVVSVVIAMASPKVGWPSSAVFGLLQRRSSTSSTRDFG